jgi:murein DD-endopeptidase MepM/ murein hydrolase activator NlpD
MDATPFRFGRKPGRPAPVLTLRHGERELSLTLSPGLALAGLGLVAAALVCGLAAGGYLLFHDNVVAAALRHQAAVEIAYEDRIAALRLQIDRIATRQALETDGVEAKVDALARQHSALSDTGARLAELVRQAQAVGLAAEAAPQPIGKPPRPSAGRSAALERPDDTMAEPAVAGRLDALIRDAELVNRQQLALAGQLADGAAGSVDLIETTMEKLGLDRPVPKPKPVADGIGGPFVAADAAPEAAVGRAAQLIDKLGALRRRIAVLPLRRPLAGPLTVTSGFGGRSDPFLGAPALHTGVDLRADTGTPVLATAPGTIETTGRQGGYGLAVDIDHGGGIATRYGHLSRIAVSEGQHVVAGDVIGYAGSTGRSTGPHLHYETRIAGEAVDPADWLAAGERLTAFLD